MSDADAATRQALAGALLGQGGSVHLFSCALTISSVAGLGLVSVLPGAPASPALLLCSALLGVAETYFAVRVGFDAAIFRLAARGAADWDGVDRGLASLGLVAPAGVPRSEESRVKGALRLLRRQVLAAALQGLLLLTALATGAYGFRVG